MRAAIIPEKSVQKAIIDYLTLRRVWVVRMNTGAIVSEYKGKTRLHKYGYPGMADLYVRTPSSVTLWIECKSSIGKQSDLQRQFQMRVETLGDIYVLARSVDDVIPLFGGLR